MGIASLTFLGCRVLIICLTSTEVTWVSTPPIGLVTFHKLVSHKGIIETNMHRGMANPGRTQWRLSSDQREKTQETQTNWLLEAWILSSKTMRK